MNVADSLWDPLIACLPPDVAQCMLRVGPDPAIQELVDDLAAKANLGTLTPKESECYSELIEYIDLVAIFKAKLRLWLLSQGR